MTSMHLDANACTHCGACVTTCPASIFERTTPNAPPTIASHHAFCIVCGHCVAICPANAITHDAFPPDRIQPLQKSLRASFESVLELLRERRSVRDFTEEPIAREDINRILAAVDQTPHARNFRNTNILVVQKKEILKEIVALTAAYFAKVERQLQNPLIRFMLRLTVGSRIDGAVKMLPELHELVKAVRTGHDLILHDAPCLMLFHSKAGDMFSDVNAQLAVQNATFAAQSLGLGSFYTGFIVATCARDKAIARLLEIPPSHGLWAGLALGNPTTTFRKWIQHPPLAVRILQE